MLTFQETHPIELPYPLEQIAPLEDILFFDIETTGFQADVSSLYLIGCGYFEQNNFHIVQYFADNYHSEETLLHAFFELLNKHKTLIHFNGNGFDIPYIMKKCAQYHLSYNFDACNSIDLFKEMKPYKKIFQLENYKQKTIEKFLQIGRTDPYNGGELIQVYGDYIKAKVAYKDTAPYLEPLLLHNKEDVKGMVKLTSILGYIDIFEKPPVVDWFNLKEQSLEIILSLPQVLPSKINYQGEGYTLSVNENHVFLTVQTFHGELKYFYPDYKEYYYLPEEDMAIHKSVASFVDKDYRQKATRSNCYMRKEGIFIPIYENCLELTTFKKEYHDKQLFIELAPEIETDKQAVQHIANLLLKQFVAM